MLEMLEECFDRLQTLDIRPTLENMEKLLQTLYDLREIYKRLKEEQGDGREEADPAGRDGD